MSTTYHTDVSVGAANNASVVNTPLGQLDAALVALHTQTDTVLTSGGAIVAGAVGTAAIAAGAITAAKRDQTTMLTEWTQAQAFDINGTPTFDATWTNVISSVVVVWPDGTGGTYTATSINATWGMVDAYTVTYTGTPTKTVTQAAVTRDSQGRVTNRPTLGIT